MSGADFRVGDIVGLYDGDVRKGDDLRVLSVDDPERVEVCNVTETHLKGRMLRRNLRLLRRAGDDVGGNEVERLRSVLEEIAKNCEAVAKGGLPHWSKEDLAAQCAYRARAALDGWAR